MRLRAFGNTPLQVSELGLGCARIGGVFQGDTLSFVRLLAVARDAGITFFDTADMYSQGESEALLGKAVASGGKVKGFKPHATAFLGYLISHESQHS